MRLALWGVAATVALAATALAAYSDGSAQRTPATPVPAATAVARPPVSTAQVPRPNHLDVETRRLSDAVRSLSADRDRLLARIAVLERSVEDMTGSIRPPDTWSSTATVPVLPIRPLRTTTATPPAATPQPAETTAPRSVRTVPHRRPLQLHP
jgi:hypothetical protein